MSDVAPETMTQAELIEEVLRLRAFRAFAREQLTQYRLVIQEVQASQRAGRESA